MLKDLTVPVPPGVVEVTINEGEAFAMRAVGTPAAGHFPAR